MSDLKQCTNKTNVDAKHPLKDAAHDFEAWLKGSRYSSVHLNNLCKQTGCNVEQEGQISLYFKQEETDVPILLTLLP